MTSILHLIASADPQGGGPLAGVVALARQRAARGIQTTVVSLDAPGSGFGAGQPFTLVELGPGKGHYGYNNRLVPWLKAHAGAFDGVVVDGLWQYHSFGAWRALTAIGKPYAIFTHGMLDPWFKRRYPLKHLKKWLYWPWGEYRVLRDAGAVLFTTDEERLLARQSFWLYRAKEQVVGYGIASPPPPSPDHAALVAAACPNVKGRRFLLFLSRIHRKKGCDLLIAAFAAVARQNPDLDLVMAGPDDPANPWIPALRAQAETAGIADRIHWPGMVQGDTKWSLLRATDAFCLTSHQENFGIAVAEALAVGTPVLISNQINIWREIAHDGCGLVEPDTQEGATALLIRWLALDPAARAAHRTQAARAFALPVPHQRLHRLVGGRPGHAGGPVTPRPAARNRRASLGPTPSPLPRRTRSAWAGAPGTPNPQRRIAP
jgi:glycosyltransferase involved in cell wall biosynthesis